MIRAGLNCSDEKDVQYNNEALLMCAYEMLPVASMMAKNLKLVSQWVIFFKLLVNVT